jgi:superfamily II DNA or RNA helicase
MKGVGIVAGDWNKKQAAERVDKPKLIGDLLENWLRICPERKTIIFATNVNHSKHIRDKFERNGVNIAHVDSHTKDEDRSDIYNWFENEDLQIITNVGVACEGSDLPIASCICVARPTRMLSRWIQMAGRGARPHPGKTDYYLLDFAGCIDEHGFVDDPVEWSLDVKKLAAKKKKPRKKEKHIMTCSMCSRSFTGKRCPDCGTEIKDYGKKIEVLDAELVKVKGNGKKTLSMSEKRKWWAQFEYIRREKGYNPGWTAHKYREKVGCWPRGMDDVAPIPPDTECKNWMKHLTIKWVKSKKRQEAKCA